MEEFTAVVMLKSKAGILDKELDVYRVSGDGALMSGIFAEEEGGLILCRVTLTAASALEDWEFEAVYDYYDETIYESLGASCAEKDGGENPMWVVTFPFSDDTPGMENKITSILSAHAAELASVYEAIAGRREEYEPNE